MLAVTPYIIIPPAIRRLGTIRTYSRISGSKTPPFRLASHFIDQSENGPPYKLPKMEPIKGPIFMYATPAVLKLYGGEEKKMEFMTTMRTSQATEKVNWTAVKRTWG